MNERDNIGEWIRLANMDIATARHMFETYYPKPLEVICFHSQQAAEKMLKAYLLSRQTEPPRTHDMRILCNLCCEIESSFSSVLKSAVLLTGYGVVPRYPAELGLIELDAEKAIAYAEDVVLFVNSKFIVVKLIQTDKKNFLDLLLLADEQESMIDKYLERGELFALYDNESLRSVCVVTREGDDVCELKNIATYEKYHGMGYGSKLLKHIISFYSGKYKTMLVGTGDVPRALRFYEKNGFVISHRAKNFFTDNYDHPMIEDGIQLNDMVYLKRDLSKN